MGEWVNLEMGEWINVGMGEWVKSGLGEWGSTGKNIHFLRSTPLACSGYTVQSPNPPKWGICSSLFYLNVLGIKGRDDSAKSIIFILKQNIKLMVFYLFMCECAYLKKPKCF